MFIIGLEELLYSFTNIPANNFIKRVLDSIDSTYFKSLYNFNK